MGSVSQSTSIAPTTSPSSLPTFSNESRLDKAWEWWTNAPVAGVSLVPTKKHYAPRTLAPRTLEPRTFEPRTFEPRTLEPRTPEPFEKTPSCLPTTRETSMPSARTLAPVAGVTVTPTRTRFPSTSGPPSPTRAPRTRFPRTKAPLSPTRAPRTRPPRSRPPGTRVPSLATLAPVAGVTVVPTRRPRTRFPRSRSPESFTPTRRPRTRFPRSRSPVATLAPVAGISIAPTAPTCPATTCAIYSGDPHLVRSRILCNGTTETLPSQHCTKALTLIFANSPPFWRIAVIQNFRSLGRNAPATIAAVTFFGPNEEIRFGSTPQWPNSTRDFNVTTVKTLEFRGKLYDTSARVTGRDLDATVERNLFATLNGQVRQIMSLNVCSASIRSGIALTGCPAHSLLALVNDVELVDPENAKRVLNVSQHDECINLPDPFKTNCNIDLSSVRADSIAPDLGQDPKRNHVEEAQAVAAQASKDSENQAAWYKQHLCQRTYEYGCQ